jgi:hypothetical protein
MLGYQKSLPAQAILTLISDWVDGYTSFLIDFLLDRSFGDFLWL